MLTAIFNGRKMLDFKVYQQMALKYEKIRITMNEDLCNAYQ